ncbi:uncharacterized protein [Argopecten irradians]|uniref:uncharacterized protein n=1 Tax=Argopecten irradians TaxID=31199 RepID=UPI00371EEFF4
MSVLCFSFDCDFTDDGTSNCFTSDTKYSQTTTHKPTTTTPTPHPTTLPSGTGKVTTGAIYTTTANISTPVNPWQHKVTSHPPAGGVAIYIPCSVAGCVLLIVLLFCIGFVRRRRYRRLSSEDRQLLQPDHDDTIIPEVQLDTEVCKSSVGEPRLWEVYVTNAKYQIDILWIIIAISVCIMYVYKMQIIFFTTSF